MSKLTTSGRINKLRMRAHAWHTNKKHSHQLHPSKMRCPQFQTGPYKTQLWTNKENWTRKTVNGNVNTWTQIQIKFSTSKGKTVKFNQDTHTHTHSHTHIHCRRSWQCYPEKIPTLLLKCNWIYILLTILFKYNIKQYRRLTKSTTMIVPPWPGQWPITFELS